MSDELGPENVFDCRQAMLHRLDAGKTAPTKPLAVVEIYVPLLNEGTLVLCPTRGLVLGPDVVQVIATTDYDPSIEEWEFPPDSRVRCVAEFRGGRTLLVARNRVA